MRLWTTKLRACAVAMLGAGAVAAASAACVDELNPGAAGTAKGKGATGQGSVVPAWLQESSPADSLPAEMQLQTVAREAARRSALLGAARLLAEAADDDLSEAQAARMPQVDVGGTMGPLYSRYDGQTLKKGNQSTASLNATGLVYDGGRSEAMVRYRREMALAAVHGMQSTREQVVLEAVATALERNRYRMQAKVYQQYARKMSCLSEALEQIVAVDRGRASELLQARKTQAQAELARDGAMATSRQFEQRLRKIIGDQPALGEGLGVPLSQIMSSGELFRLLDQSDDIRQIKAQAEGALRYAESVDAARSPQVSWVASTTAVEQSGVRSGTAQAGLSVTYSLFDAGGMRSAASAAAKRAAATQRQYEELMNARVSKVNEMLDVTQSAFDRAHRYVEVIKDSDRVRTATFQQWSQLGKRSLFDVMSAEGDHFNLRVAYVNALYDGYVANAQLRSLGGGLMNWLLPGER